MSTTNNSKYKNERGNLKVLDISKNVIETNKINIDTETLFYITKLNIDKFDISNNFNLGVPTSTTVGTTQNVANINLPSHKHI